MEITAEYKHWITEVKAKVRSSPIKAAVAVNTALIEFYWDLGRMLSEKVKQSNWGDKILENVSRDLHTEFPDMKGFSVTNLKYTKQFFEYFTFRPQVGDGIDALHDVLSQSAESQQNKISPQVGGEYVQHHWKVGE